MTKPQLLETITALSHRFGTCDYVRGGGGNTSAKNDTTLWVKPSGTTLAGLSPERFVAMDRRRLGRLYDITPPADAAAREALVKQIMAEAVHPGSSGRASVEAPLHDTFSARFVVHTHPALVNGLTCAQDGPAVCRELFPQALWIDYTDPGYTLCLRVRADIVRYREQTGREPQLVILQNHGLFVAAQTPREIEALYDQVFDRLQNAYQQAGVPTIAPQQPAGDTASLTALRQAIGAIEALRPLPHLVISGPIIPPDGPLTPDHLVYAKSYYLTEYPTEETVSAFIERYGYAPRVIALADCTVGLGESDRSARLALELAQDGARVRQLAEAFGGVRYMSRAARLFIENWEVESYRKQQQM